MTIVRLSQIEKSDGTRQLIAIDRDNVARIVIGFTRLYDLAWACIEQSTSLSAMAKAAGLGDAVDLAAALENGEILTPIDHEDGAHLYVTGTGLTHLGSAAGRDAMHKKLSEPDALTDSMRMFKMGLEGGKPDEGQKGVQPEWFYKGNGDILKAPEAAFLSPSFAWDGSEEPEIAGIYLIGPDGTPYRLGFTIGNEFSDHLTEKENYLYLAHSKLRQASLGPELLLGELPAAVVGTSKVIRNEVAIFDAPFVSGEENMSHTIANLEYHHFKYDIFAKPGDVHVHFFGTATLSFAQGIKTEDGDVFEIAANGFGLPLRNTLSVAAQKQVVIKTL